MVNSVKFLFSKHIILHFQCMEVLISLNAHQFIKFFGLYQLGEKWSVSVHYE